MGEYGIVGTPTYSVAYNTLDEMLAAVPDNNEQSIQASDIRNSLFTLWEKSPQIQLAPTIPAPLIGIDNTNRQLVISFQDNGFDFTQGNPEIFLFRYRNTRHSKHRNRRRKKRSGFVHPSTYNASTKWQGWKFFNGEHSYYSPEVGYNTITGRVTEWTIPSDLIPYQQFRIDFNENMFWNKRTYGDLVVTPTVEFDINPYDGDFEVQTHYYGSTSSTMTEIRIGSARQREDNPPYNSFTNIIRYALAVAVDNPLATKTNGLCPKIFGPFSEEFFAIADRRVGSSRILLDKIQSGNHTHIRASVMNSPM